jgi:hypothetical protein
MPWGPVNRQSKSCVRFGPSSHVLAKPYQSAKRILVVRSAVRGFSPLLLLLLFEDIVWPIDGEIRWKMSVGVNPFFQKINKC